MKILQVIPYFCFGGAETMCESLTYALGKLGHTVRVVSLYAEHTPISQRMERAGVPIRYLDKKLGMDLSMVPKLTKIIREETPDVIHTHLDVIKYTVAAARLAGVTNCVHTIHNVAQQEAEGRVQKIINGFYFPHGWSVPVALSPQVQRTVESFYSLNQADIPVIYNGIQLDSCVPKTAYSLTDTPTLVHIGRFNEQKNHALLLRAFQRILVTYPQCRLLLLGDGELRQEMEALAAQLCIQGRVFFLGSQDNVYTWLNRADIFLLPSRYEGMPMTLIEAMGTGLPIVASAVGGVPDMLTDGESALLTPCDEEAVAQAVIRLLENQALREKLGQNALKESSRFSANHMARKYLEIYCS